MGKKEDDRSWQTEVREYEKKGQEKLNSMKVPCRYCSKKIIWVEADGKKIPLDPVPPVYYVDWARGKTGHRCGKAYMVSHFATCTGANQASKDAKKKREKEGEHED